jgi:hypothetical protein
MGRLLKNIIKNVINKKVNRMSHHVYEGVGCN